MLRAQLAGEEDELLRADAVGVHVDDDLKADLLEPAEPEVGHLDRVTLVRRQDDARVREQLGRAQARLCVGHSVTGAFVDADSCSASSARAWPIASSRASSSSPVPRIASLTFSSSSR